MITLIHIRLVHICPRVRRQRRKVIMGEVMDAAQGRADIRRAAVVRPIGSSGELSKIPRMRQVDLQSSTEKPREKLTCHSAVRHAGVTEVAPGV